MSELEDSLVSLVVPRLVRPVAADGLPLSRLVVTVTCTSNDTSEVLLFPGMVADSGQYGRGAVVLVFQGLESGELQPVSQNLTIQGVADTDNGDGAVAVAVDCRAEVTSVVASPGEALSQYSWVGTRDLVVVWNRLVCAPACVSLVVLMQVDLGQCFARRGW